MSYIKAPVKTGAFFAPMLISSRSISIRPRRCGYVVAMRRLGAIVLVIGAGWRCAAAGLGLELLAADGARHSAFRPSDHGIEIVSAQGAMGLPDSYQWKIHGDFLETFPAIAWSPACALYRRTLKRRESFPEFDALVALEASAPGFWPAKELKDGIAVFLWVHAGRPVQVNPVPLRSAGSADGRIVALARFRLSEAEARGSPIVLLLRDGQWVLPPAGSSPAFQQAMATMYNTPGMLPPAVLTALGDDEAMLLFHEALASSRLEWIEPLLQRIPPESLARWASPLLSTAVDRGRDAAARALLPTLGDRLSGSEIAALLERAIRNRQDACALVLVEWAGSVRRTIPRTDELTSLAFEEGLVGTVTILAGARGLPRLAAKVGGAKFAAIAQRGHADMIRMLIANGVRPARADPDCAALILAAQTDDGELASLLLAAGAKPIPATASRGDPLLQAVRAGHRIVAAILLKAGADSTRRDAAGATVLHAALLSPDEGMVRSLLEQGVRPLPDGRAGGPLELALLLHHRAAVSALVRAGERLPSAGEKFLEGLKAAIALDQPELLEHAQRHGWDPTVPLDEDWTPTALADAYESAHCIAWLRGRMPDAASLDLKGGDQAPVPVKLVLDHDVRSSERDHPAMTLSLRGVVDTHGRLRSVTVVGTADYALALAIRQSAAKFRFAPARRRGESVCARIELPLLLPAQSRRTFALSELDLPPVRIAATVATTRNFVPPVFRSNRWMSSSAPAVPGLGFGDIATILEGLSTFGVEMGPSAIYDVTGRRRPSVRFVIAPDGTAREPTVLRAADRFDAEGALKNVASFRFAPGIVNGRAVSVPVTLDVSSQP